jgi:hypothetical protein
MLRRARKRSLEKADPAGRSRQRASEATLHARRAADKAAVGKHGARGLRSRSSPETRGARIGERSGLRLREVARRVAGALKLEVRRQAKLHPMVRRAVARAGRKLRAGRQRRVGAGQKVAKSQGNVAGGNARSGVEQHTECSYRASVAEVGETHLSRGEAWRGAIRGAQSGGMARSDPPALDGAGAGSRRVKGCEGRARDREQRPRLCLLGAQAPGRSDGRRPGSCGARRPNPAAGPAGLVR